MTAAQIESVLHGAVSNIAEQAKELICREADAYIQNLLAAMTESGLDIRAIPVIFWEEGTPQSFSFVGRGGARECNVVFSFSWKRNETDFAPTR